MFEGSRLYADLVQVHLASLGLGAAYAYFDLKHHLWIPLVSEMSSTQEPKTQSEE